MLSMEIVVLDVKIILFMRRPRLYCYRSRVSVPIAP